MPAWIARNWARALEEHLRAQLTLAEGCRDRAVAAAGPHLRSVWIGHFVRVSNAMAVTGSALARVVRADGGVASLSLAPLRLPALPRLPEEEGYPPPPEFSKTTPGGISSRISSLNAFFIPPGVRGRKTITQAPVSATEGRLRVKSKGGAPKRNRNAQTSGGASNIRAQSQCLSARIEGCAGVIAGSPAPAASPRALPHPDSHALLHAHPPERPPACRVRCNLRTTSAASARAWRCGRG
jgi:hypothetical protein